jgi:putative Mg2+ transporter-C (MgtC) family protein
MPWAEHWTQFPRIVEPLLITYVLTAIIGWERELELHSTGLRTFPLVGLACCGFLLAVGGEPNVVAQSRALQGTITSIGFIGGGAILKDGPSVRGTATAASILNAGVIGASVALGRYDVGLVLALLNLFTLRGLKPLKERLDHARDARDTKEP